MSPLFYPPVCVSPPSFCASCRLCPLLLSLFPSFLLWRRRLQMGRKWRGRRRRDKRENGRPTLCHNIFGKELQGLKWMGETPSRFYNGLWKWEFVLCSNFRMFVFSHFPGPPLGLQPFGGPERPLDHPAPPTVAECLTQPPTVVRLRIRAKVSRFPIRENSIFFKKKVGFRMRF